MLGAKWKHTKGHGRTGSSPGVGAGRDERVNLLRLLSQGPKGVTRYKHEVPRDDCQKFEKVLYLRGHGTLIDEEVIRSVEFFNYHTEQRVDF